ncbi:MAG: NADH-ubiquinone/plastoquinone oxidoreductase chain 6 [Verrucomicrobiales bacterium]|nr:NADH-ubiquinone/plastoquinone oxidoreductase chain 6 [Verrucomicrobiales bacterium]
MSAGDGFFYFFAFLTLFFGVLVVYNPFSRNPVTSAMFLVLTILSLAGLFLLLNAFFLAAVQVLVYAGAVIVLFLFVIMLLDIKEEERRKIRVISAGTGFLAVAAIAFTIISRLIWTTRPGAGLPAATVVGSTAELGTILFQKFLLPFEILSLLLLVAMVGVILLSKKDLK